MAAPSWRCAPAAKAEVAAEPGVRAPNLADPPAAAGEAHGGNLRDSTWADYTSRSRLLWSLLGIGLLAVLAVARLFLIEHLGWHGLSWPLALWTLAVAAAALHLQDFRCPRCQLRFFHRAPLLLALRGSRCVHCCLPKE